MGEHLSAEAVFVSMALFNTLRLTMTLCFPNSIAMGAETLVACSRIQVIYRYHKFYCDVIDLIYLYDRNF